MHKDMEVANVAVHSDINNLVCLGWYTWPLNTLIHKMKFQRRPAISQLLSQWFVNRALQLDASIPDAIVAVPATKWRMLTRGYNQAALLATHTGRALNIRDISSCVYRKHAFTPQHVLNRDQRLKRDLGFQVEALPEDIKHLVIIDDVLTTGSTLMSLARVIHNKHPHIKIDAWVMAVTPAGY